MLGQTRQKVGYDSGVVNARNLNRVLYRFSVSLRTRDRGIMDDFRMIGAKRAAAQLCCRICRGDVMTKRETENEHVCSPSFSDSALFA